jgi:hypothetical protein
MTAARVSLANHARGDGFAIEQLLTSSDASKTIYFTNKHSHKILAGAARDVLTVYQGGTKMLYAQRRACGSVRSAQRSCLRLRLRLRTKKAWHEYFQILREFAARGAVSADLLTG